VLDEGAAAPIVKAAVERRITFFDTADAYSGCARSLTGRCLARMFRRHVVVHQGLHSEGAARTTGGRPASTSLRIDAFTGRWDMDYVDLSQIHRWDYRTPIEETCSRCHERGVCGGAGPLHNTHLASLMFAWQFAKAQPRLPGTTGPVVSMRPTKPDLLPGKEREMLPQCVDQGVAVIRGARCLACWPAAYQGGERRDPTLSNTPVRSHRSPVR